jgi:hypothetical protein
VLVSLNLLLIVLVHGRRTRERVSGRIVALCG